MKTKFIFILPLLLFLAPIGVRGDGPSQEEMDFWVKIFTRDIENTAMIRKMLNSGYQGPKYSELNFTNTPQDGTRVNIQKQEPSGVDQTIKDISKSIGDALENTVIEPVSDFYRKGESGMVKIQKEAEYRIKKRFGAPSQPGL